MTDITLDPAKLCLESKADLTPNEVLELMALVETTPQPPKVIERVLTEANKLKQQLKNSQPPKSNASKLNSASISKVKRVVSKIRLHKENAIGEYLGQQAIHDLKRYVDGVGKLLQFKEAWGKSDNASYLTLARILCINDAFQLKLKEIRDKLKLGSLPWLPLTKLIFVAPHDLIESLANTSGAARSSLAAELVGHINVVCRGSGLTPENGFGVVTALLAFDVKVGDLLSNSPHHKVVLHFAAQKSNASFSRVRVNIDEVGLFGGLLVALAHIDSISLGYRERLPDSIIEWLDYAKEAYTLLGLNSAQPKAIDHAIEEIGGGLSNLLIPLPQVSIMTELDMTKEDMAAAWEIAQARMLQVYDKKIPFRKWNNWPEYDKQIHFYLLVEEEKSRKPWGARYRAMERYDDELKAQGKPPYFKRDDSVKYDITLKPLGDNLLEGVNKKKNQKTLFDTDK